MTTWNFFAPIIVIGITGALVVTMLYLWIKLLEHLARMNHR